VLCSCGRAPGKADTRTMGKLGKGAKPCWADMTLRLGRALLLYHALSLFYTLSCYKCTFILSYSGGTPGTIVRGVAKEEERQTYEMKKETIMFLRHTMLSGVLAALLICSVVSGDIRENQEGQKLKVDFVYVEDIPQQSAIEDEVRGALADVGMCTVHVCIIAYACFQYLPDCQCRYGTTVLYFEIRISIHCTVCIWYSAEYACEMPTIECLCLIYMHRNQTYMSVD